MSNPTPVPWRTIWATIGSVILTGLVVLSVRATGRILVWLITAAFLAVALNPAVDLFVRRLRLRRGAATGLVLFIGLVVVAGTAFLFVRPLVNESSRLAGEMPGYVEDAQNGRGPIGRVVSRYGLDEQIRSQADQLSGGLGRLGSQSLAVLGTVGSAVVGTVTVLVLTFMILLEGDKLMAGLLSLLPERHRDHVSRVAADSAHAVNGYVTGNLVISIIAGSTSFVVLLTLGIPFAGLLALWVGITDLIPLIGATLGAVVVVIVAFFTAPVVGIVAAAFFVVYQLIENHVLQPMVQARTVRLNPLTVLVSALVGVEVAGLMGALLAIPAAGVITVILRDVNSGMRPELRGVAEPVGDEPAFVGRDDDEQLVTAQERARRIDAG